MYIKTKFKKSTMNTGIAVHNNNKRTQFTIKHINTYSVSDTNYFCKVDELYKCTILLYRKTYIHSINNNSTGPVDL